MTDQVVEVEQRHVVERFNAEEFVVWVRRSGPVRPVHRAHAEHLRPAGA